MSDILGVFQKGAKVWVPNPYPSVASSSGPDACELDVDSAYRDAWMPAAVSLRPLWVPAEVVAVKVPEQPPAGAESGWTGGAEASVLTLLLPRLALTLPLIDLLPMNPDAGLDDCADFTFLHDAALQYSVARRALEDRWMTRAGPQLLLSVNPCRAPVDRDGVSLFDALSMARYRCRLAPRVLEAVPPALRPGLLLPPHIYEIADSAYEAACAPSAPASASQALLFLGESGSGKSEAAKHALQYLVCAGALATEGAAPRQPRAEVLAAALTTLRAATDAATVGAAVPAGSGLSLLDGPSGRPPCDLLARPDVTAARQDAEVRSGPLGSYLNPWLTHAHPKSAALLPPVSPAATALLDAAASSSAVNYMFLLPSGVTRDVAAPPHPGTPRGGLSLGGSGLMNVASRIGSRLTRLERAILAAETVLDGFGSASTPANAHSSRFSRVTRLYYAGGPGVAAAHISAGLLERHRVTWASPSGASSWPAGALAPDLDGSVHASGAPLAGVPLGRNFHVFYRLLAGANRSLRTDLSLGTLGDYAILTGKGVGGAVAPVPLSAAASAVGGFSVFNAASPAGGAANSPMRPVPPAAVASGSVTDAEEFGVLCRALSELGFSLPEQSGMWRVVSAILMLGNTRVVDAPAAAAEAPEASAPVAEGGGAALANEREVKRAAELLGVDPALFAQLTVNKRAGAVWAPKKAAEARSGVEALLQFTYERLFAWLVGSLNSALADAAGDGFSAVMPPSNGAAAASKWVPPACVAVADVAGLEGVCTAEDAGTQLADYASLDAGVHPGGLLPLASAASPAASALAGYGSGLEACVRGLPTLLHNYAAERAHELFIAAVFRSEQAVYAAEGVDASGVTFNDNAPVLDTLADQRVGLLTSCINEACGFARSTDASVMTKAATLHRRNAAVFVRPGGGAEAAASGAGSAAAATDPSGLLFALRHTGGTVLYSGAGVVASCRVRADADILALLAQSSVPLVAALFGAGGGRLAVAALAPSPWEAAAALAAPPADAQAQAQQFFSAAWMDAAERLLSPLTVAQQHFVRCLRPNASLQQRRVDPVLLHAQLGGSGALHAVALRHSGFTHRTTFADFYARYILLLARNTPTLRFPPPAGAPMRELCAELLSRIVEEHTAVFGSVDVRRAAQFGSTRVFLRRHLAEALDVLRDARIAEMDRRAHLIAATWRGHAVRTRLRTIWDGVRRFQAVWRTLHARQAFLLRVRAATTIAAAARRRAARGRYLKARSACVVLQAWGRRVAARMRFLRLNAGVAALHALARGFTVRVHVMRLLAAATVIQSAARRFLARSQASRLRNAAALCLQAAWRGYRFRMDNEEILQHLYLLRVQRVRRRAAGRIAAAWRGWLVRGQFLRIRAAAIDVQRFARAVLARVQFLAARSALLRMQSLARGYLARDVARRLRVLHAVGDELWRVQLVREQEALAAAGIAAERAALAITAGSTSAAPAPESGFSAAAEAGFSSPGSDSAPVAEVLHIDTCVDTSAFYPGSLAGDVAGLDRTLRLRGYGLPAAEGGAAAQYVPSTHLASLAVGASHALALTGAGHVLSWGFGDRGQCGHGRPSRDANPRVVAALLSDAHWRQAAAAAGLLLEGDAPEAPVTLLPAVRVRAIACGAEHSLVLSDAGALWAFGGNRRGQLGLGLHTGASSALPIRVILPGDSAAPASSEPLRVAQVCAGASFSVALAANGALYSWGAAEFTGHGVPAVAVPEGGGSERTVDVPSPALIKDFPPPLARGASASADSSSPGRPAAASRRAIRSIAAGPESIVAVTADGDVWTWGDGSLGRLGLGEDVYRRPLPEGGDWEYFVGRFRHRYAPCLVEGLASYGKHARVVAVSAGWKHMLAVSSTGRVFAWGGNAHGQLGLGCVGDVSEDALRAHDMPVPTLPYAPLAPATAAPATAANPDDAAADPATDAANVAARAAVSRYPAGTYAPRPYVALPVLLGGVLASRHAAQATAAGRASFVLTDSGSLWAWGLAGPALGGGCHGMAAVNQAALQAAAPTPEAPAAVVAGVLRQGSVNATGSPAPVNAAWGTVPGRSLRAVAASASGGSVSITTLAYAQAPITPDDLLAAALARASGGPVASPAPGSPAAVAAAAVPAAALAGNGLVQAALALLAEVGAAACVSAAGTSAFAAATLRTLTAHAHADAAPALLVDAPSAAAAAVAARAPRDSLASDVGPGAAIDAEARVRLQVGLGGGRQVVAAVARAAAEGPGKQQQQQPGGVTALGVRQALLEVLGHLAAAASQAKAASAAHSHHQAHAQAQAAAAEAAAAKGPRGLVAARQALHLPAGAAAVAAPVLPPNRAGTAAAAVRAAAAAAVSSPARIAKASGGLGRARAALGLDPRPTTPGTVQGASGAAADAVAPAFGSPRAKTLAAMLAKNAETPAVDDVACAVPPVSASPPPALTATAAAAFSSVTPGGRSAAGGGGGGGRTRGDSTFSDYAISPPKDEAPAAPAGPGDLPAPLSPWVLADRLADMLATTMAQAAAAAPPPPPGELPLLPPQPQLLRILRAVMRLGAELTLHPRTASALLAMPTDRARRLSLQQLRVLVARLRARDGASEAAADVHHHLHPLLPPASAVAQAITAVVDSAAARGTQLARIAAAEDDADRPRPSLLRRKQLQGTSVASPRGTPRTVAAPSAAAPAAPAAPPKRSVLDASRDRSKITLPALFRRGQLFRVARARLTALRASRGGRGWARVPSRTLLLEGGSSSGGGEAPPPPPPTRRLLQQQPEEAAAPAPPAAAASAAAPSSLFTEADLVSSPSVRAMLRSGSPVHGAAGGSPAGRARGSDLSPILASPPRGLLVGGGAAPAAAAPADAPGAGGEWTLPRSWRADAAPPAAAAGAGAGAAGFEPGAPVAVLGRPPPPPATSPRTLGQQQTRQSGSPPQGGPGAPNAEAPAAAGALSSEPGIASQVKALQAQLVAIKRRSDELAQRMRLGGGGAAGTA